MIINIDQISSESWFQKNHYMGFGNFIQTRLGPLHYVDFPGNQTEEEMLFQNNHNAIPTIFIHGNLGWSYEWRHILKSLPCRGIAPDLLGFGLSARPSHSIALEQHSESLALLASELKLNQFNIVAHGIGVRIAIELLSKFPTLAHKVIFISANHADGVAKQYSFVSNLKKIIRFFTMKMYRFFGFSSTYVNRLLWDHLATLPLADQLAFIHMQFLGPSKDAISFSNNTALTISRNQGNQKAVSILNDIPKLFISGKLDLITGVEHLSLWQNQLPEAPSVILSKSGHWPHLDNAKITADIVHQFISDH